MPRSSSRRSGVRDGGRALVSQTYPAYIHHSTPKMSSTRSAPVTVISSARTPVSWVMAKTKTRWKKSSSVLTRSGGSSSLGWFSFGHRRAAMSWRYQPPRREIVAASR